LSDLAVACNKILTLEKAFGENRFVCNLPFRQIKLPDKSKFEIELYWLIIYFKIF